MLKISNLDIFDLTTKIRAETKGQWRHPVAGKSERACLSLGWEPKSSNPDLCSSAPSIGCPACRQIDSHESGKQQ
jgi:hypothetical protein